MTLSKCMSVVNRLSDKDRDEILARIDGLLADGMPANQAAKEAALGLLADARLEAGQEILRSADRTSTPEFKRWFGNSKMRDEDGNPRVHYHATTTDANVLKPGGKTFPFQSGRAIWLTPHADHQAAMHNVGGHGNFRDNANVMPLYVKMERPLLLDDSETLNWAREVFANGSLEFPQLISDSAVKEIQKDYDGIIFEGVKLGWGDRADEIIVFDSNQIKSSIGNVGTYGQRIPTKQELEGVGMDEAQAGIWQRRGDVRLSAERDDLGYYSGLARGIDGMATKSAAAGAWKAQLKGLINKGQVKQDEITWSGVEDWLDLQPGKVSKDDLLTYLQQGGVKIQETTLGRENKPVTDRAMLAEKYDDAIAESSAAGGAMNPDYIASLDADKRMPEEQALLDAYNAVNENPEEDYLPAVDNTKYGNYTLPGGENYREVLLTLPGSRVNTRKQWALIDADGETISVRSDPPNQRWNDEVTNKGYRIEERQVPDSQANDRAGVYTSSHWSQPNVLAHLRVNDRTDADGKRVLFVEEVQSDWGQDGKKKGFSTGKEAKNFGEFAKREGISDADMKRLWNGQEQLSGADKNLWDRWQEELGRGAFGIRSAPFVTKTDGWLNLALKRVVTMAVDGGYDAVAFVNGQQSADRYDLSKQISRFSYEPTQEPGEFEIAAYDMDGKEVMSKEDVDLAGIEELVGKDIARKVEAREGEKDSDGYRDWHHLKGLDLQVGGEGMKSFYDKIVPSATKALLKKTGGGEFKDIVFGGAQESGRFNVFDDDSGDRIFSTNNQEDAREYVRSYPGDASVQDTGGAKRVELSGAQPGFDITDAMRKKVVSEGLPLFSRQRDLSTISLAGGYTFGDLMKSSKKVTWWDKTVGSQFNLAEKHPQFKRVYDNVQHFIGDISKYATRASDMAPTILPKLETLSDIARQPLSVEDTKTLSKPVFDGTLLWARDEDGEPVRTDDVGLAGVVWRDNELREMFGLNDKQIGLYRETRRAINKSLNDLGVSDMLRYAGKDAANVRTAAMDASTAKHAADIITEELNRLISETPNRKDVLDDTIRGVKEKAGMIQGLIAKGYAPLSRYGDYTVYVTKAGGAEQIWFGMYETEREANKAAREWADLHPDAEVKTGVMSKESYKLFKGVTPETLALFGESLGLEESGTDKDSKVFQEYLKLAKTNRSAMKRMIERKGVAGFSEDVGRVLAGFVYSNARQSSTNLHAGEISKAASEIQDGDLRDHAIKLVEYVQNPAEEAQALRGLLFANYIGGSIASAMVNLTQTATTTWPVLTQHFGMAKAAKSIQEATATVARGTRGDADLEAAMKRADEEGITAPQETHNLQAQAAGRSSLATGDGTNVGNFLAKAGNAKNKVMLVWGKAFSWAEQTNRKIAFAAAYKLSRERGDADPFEFAARTVAETQYTMNKGNNQVWARGAVGSTLFTFRKFSVNYLEGLARLWGSGPEGKKAFALSLAVMFMLAGTGGFPFAENLDDAIDFVAQRVLGKNFHSKEAKRQFFADILGNDLAEFVTQGISGVPGVPIDVSGRLGMNKPIPGTGLLQKKRDNSSDLKEIAGAAGDFVGRLASAGAAVAQGDVRRAAEEASPTALKNVYKAAQMAQLGYYTDSKGRKVIDTTMAEAVLKGIGFQPVSVANIQEASRTQQLQIDINKLTEGEIADIWARGRIQNKPELVQQAKDRLADWNRRNPSSPISVDASQINRRVQQANMDKAKRIQATAPKEIRKAVKEELESRLAH